MKEESSSCRDRDGAGDGGGEDEGGSGGVEGGGDGGVGHHLGHIDSRCSGKSSVISDKHSDTARAMRTKFSWLEAAGLRLVVCQELTKFFHDLEVEGVGTGVIEAKARKMVGEKDCKNLMTGGREERQGKKVKTGTNIDRVEGMRDEKVVRDLVGVKVRMLYREERELRNKYKDEWYRLEDLVRRNSTEWRRLKREVGEKMESKRTRERDRLDKKRKFLVEKVEKIPKRTHTGRESEEEDKKLLAGIKLSEKELRNMSKEENWEDKAIVYRDLARPLDKEEDLAACQDSKRANYSKLDMKNIRREREMCNTKIRYERLFNPVEDEEIEKEVEMSTEEKERIEIEKMWTEKCHDEKRGKVDMTKKKCTDVRTNQRVIMPEPRPAKEEAHLQVRTEKTLKIAREYMEKNCDKDGKLLRGGFPKELEKGVEKLQKRIRDGEIVVRTTDKSKRL